MITIPAKINKRTIPKWLKKYDYPERSEDIVAYFVSYYFWEEWHDKEHELADVYVLERAVAEAHMKAVENASDLEQASHQAMMSIIYTISKNEWHRFAEYDDLIEFLQDRLQSYETRMEERDGDELPGSFYEVKNLIDVIKYLENLGVPKEKVLGVRHNLSKAKTASGEMKKIANADITEKEKSEALLDVLDDVVNPEITVKDYRNKNKIRSIEQAKAHLPMNGEIYMVQGMELILIESPDRGSTKALELSLNGLVDGWGVRDGAALIRHLTERVYSKQKFKPARIVYVGENEPRLKFGDGGYPMPVREHLQVMILEELGHSHRLIEQLMDVNEVCWLPLYGMHTGLKQTDITEWLTKNFEFAPRGEMSAYQLVKQAIDDCYVLPEELGMYFEHGIPRIQLTWLKRNLGIDLRIQGG